MKKTILYLFFLSITTSSCFNIIIAPGKWEKKDDFKVNTNTKPSELIVKYLGDSLINEKNNYCITFFDIYCGACIRQVNYCNKLFNETKEYYDWFAVTIYDSITENKVRKKLRYPDNYLRYNFPTFYDVNGLKSSLRNLYYNNLITQNDYVPMTIIILNDTIRYINGGAISTELIYSEHKILLDSLAQINY